MTNARRTNNLPSMDDVIIPTEESTDLIQARPAVWIECTSCNGTGVSKWSPTDTICLVCDGRGKGLDPEAHPHTVTYS